MLSAPVTSPPMPEWNARAYLLLAQLLFDLDGVIHRHIGLSKLPAAMLPHETDLAVTSAWGLCIDAARILQEEKHRLQLAKVAHDLEEAPQ